MPKQPREKTRYPGVYFVTGKARDGKPEKIFYITYRRHGRLIEESAGRQFKDGMTAAKANQIRIHRIEGAQTNREREEEARKSLLPWTLDRLWAAYSLPKESKDKGYITDRGRYENYIKPILGGKEPKELAPLDIDRVRLSLAKTHRPQTVKHVLLLLQRLINFGVKKGLCAGTSFKIEMPKVDNRITEFLTPEQLQKLLSAIEAEPDQQAANFMKMALYTGLRRGELFKLKWADIDFHRGFITLQAPKGGKSEIIPINQSARSVLENHPRDPISEYVFSGRNGGKRTRPPKHIDRIREAADLPHDFRPLHGLRHTFASLLASSGQVDLYTLQRLLTHKSPLMTQRYAHLRDEALQAATELANDLITGQAQAGISPKKQAAKVKK